MGTAGKCWELQNLNDLDLLLGNPKRSRSKIKITFNDLDHDLKITYIFLWDLGHDVKDHQNIYMI